MTVCIPSSSLELWVAYQEKSELTYMNFEGGNISLYNGKEYIGEVKIQKDEHKREYVILNAAPVYLAELTEIF